ncbi:hypothetical protein [Legionella clemsonensis]|uniref:Peptidase C58 YopT-type domain-containing protein n=1 Tax=Legionella clemsonensis TaxID=1867846 RepID=A0A222P018_9GAMM|nr:hypothetical protein [Legionella clemsonensis]ASQ45171.1 hypothetical protein clem_03065 [Legionella clemsonensis]
MGKEVLKEIGKEKILSQSTNREELPSYYKVTILKENAEKYRQQFLNFMAAKREHEQLQQALHHSSKLFALDQQKTVKFDQEGICFEVQLNKSLYKTLNNFVMKYDGLCELISNYVIMEDLLGKSEETLDLNKTSFKLRERLDGFIELQQIKSSNSNFLQEKIGLFAINQKKIKVSHILHVATFFEKLKAYFFNKYPFSLFPSNNIQNNDKTANVEVLTEKLNSLENGTYIKFCVFSKGFLSFTGHSMVIKKTGDNDFSFFDPNCGEKKHLTIDKLAAKINEAMKTYEGTNMAFMDGAQYIARLQAEHTELFITQTKSQVNP